MKVNTEKLEGSKVSMEIECPQDIVNQAVQDAYKKLVRKVNIPGFRRGKAPRYIFERYYGKNELYAEAMDTILPQQYVKAVEEAEIEPVDEPEFSDIQFKENEPLKFVASVYVRPEVKLEDYSDLEIPFEEPQVSEEDIDEQIESLRERMAELKPLADDEEVKEGNYVSCHVKGIEGGDIKLDVDQDLDYLEVAKEIAFLPGLSGALKGMKKTETKEFESKYPGDEGEEEKKALFEVVLKQAYEKILPEDMEEIAKSAGKSSIDEVRKDIKKNLMTMRMRMAKEQHLDKVEEALLEKASVDIPQVMIDRKAEDLMSKFKDRLEKAKVTLDQYMESRKLTAEDIQKDLEKEASKEVKRDLVLDAIGEKENIKAPEDSIDQIISALAKDSGREPAAVKAALEYRGSLANIRWSMNRIETMKIIAMRAAEKAGSPIPPDEEESLASSEEKMEEKTKVQEEQSEETKAGEKQSKEVQPEKAPDEEKQVEEIPAEKAKKKPVSEKKEKTEPEA